MALRLRLALLFAAAAAAVIVAAGLAFAHQLRIGVEASLDTGLRARVGAVADELQSEGGYRPGPVDDLVQVRARDGSVLVASPQAGGLRLLDATQLGAAWRTETSFTTSVAGERTRLLAAPVQVTGRQLLVIVGSGTDAADAAVAGARSALLVGGPPVVVLTGLGAWLLAGAALRPVERLRSEAASIGDRDTDRRLPVPGTGDEVAALAVTFNELLGRLQGALQRERELVADAGHELRTPLAILRAELELAARPGRSPDMLRAAVLEAGEETDRLIRLTESLLLLARADSGQPFLDVGPIRLRELLEPAARGARHRGRCRGLTVAVTCPEDLHVNADRDRLRQAVDNVLDNAVRHAPEGSTVEVAAGVVEAGMVHIEVRDRGVGFPPEFLPDAFRRFHRAEAARARETGGTGLGLAIVRAIAEAHGGHVSVGNRRDGGATVTIELPGGDGHRG